MKPIALWYHCRLSGGSPPIDFNHAINVMAEQMISLRNSGLSAVADEIHIGVTGDDSDYAAACSIAPDRAQVVHNPAGSVGEQPTLHRLQDWVRTHTHWNVMYHHTKGACYAHNETWAAWRKCMTRVVVDHWQECVKALDAGYDLAGPHLITAENCNIAQIVPYFGGNFWWSKAEYLLSLPYVSEETRYEAEVWLARGPRKANIKDWAKHFPGALCLEGMKNGQ